MTPHRKEARGARGAAAERGGAWVRVERSRYNGSRGTCSTARSRVPGLGAQTAPQCVGAAGRSAWRRRLNRSRRCTRRVRPESRTCPVPSGPSRRRLAPPDT
eukprot:830580-Prymnesium_polylepis.2